MTDFPIKLRVKPTLNAFKMSSTLDAYFGTKPPPVKKKKTEEERLEVQRKYDKEERNRKFSNAWEKSFKWVEYDEETGMRCKVCIQYENKGQFIVGCKNYRLEALKIHENSEVHKVNVKRETVKSMQPAESQAEKSLLMMKRAAFAKMTILFRNAHYIAKNNRPYTDYVSLCQLDKAKNLDIGETYMSDRACQKFVHAISAARQSEQDEIINNSKFISIISDGSTDVSSKEAEIVYLRCSHKARVSTLFIGLKNVPKADGYNISCAIDSIMTDRFQDTWKGKLIAMGTDGASVMLGKSSGVIKRISDSINKPVHAIHCSAHRIELAYKDAIKEVKIWQRCDALMLNIYLFYKYSPLNRSNLNASFVSLGKKMLTPTRVGGTRWVPHHERALTTLLHGKEAIIQHLEQMQAPGEARKDQSAKGRNFLKALKDKQVVFWLHFMLDVIKALSSLSRSIQTKNSTVGDVYNELEACKAIMTNYMKSDGPNVRKFLNAYNEMEKLLESSRKAFLSKLVQSITTRFEGDMHLFKGSTVLSFHKWPGSLEDEPEFGNSHISELVEVCRPNLGDEIVDCIEAEWTRFKQELYSSKQPLQSYTWDVAADRYMSSYPNLFMLVDYLLTLPSCSVDAERGFSSMKMIKNDWRSRLGSQNLSDLILVSLETASVEVYDPTKAINMWNTGGIRSKRPFYKDELKKNHTESETIIINTVTSEEVAPAIDLEEDMDNLAVQAELFETCYDCDDENDEEDDMDLFYTNKDILSLQQKSYKLYLDLMKD